MLRFLALIFLTAQVAGVLGVVITKGDLPQEIQNCLDNVFIADFRNVQECKSSWRSLNRNTDCNAETAEVTRNKAKCQSSIDKLSKLQGRFTMAYMQNEFLKVGNFDFTTELPKSMRDCVDNLKPIFQTVYTRMKDCKGEFHTDDKECMSTVADLFEDPRISKCEKVSETLTARQKSIVQLYLNKVTFDL